jgi:FixJ family two-component response regulator
MNRSYFLIRIIDDDAAVRDSLEALLTVAGYDAAGFGSAEEYLESGDEAAPGCILLDLHMPGVGGFGLLEALAVRGEDRLPVIILTASREAALHERALSLGAGTVLTKPVSQAALLAAIEAIH